MTLYGSTPQTLITLWKLVRINLTSLEFNADYIQATRNLLKKINLTLKFL